MLEALFLAAIVLVPLVAGALAAYFARPWWWAAVAAVVFLVLFAIVPEPEEGEPRVAAGDLAFLAAVAIVAVALVWLGAAVGRRLVSRRSAA